MIFSESLWATLDGVGFRAIQTLISLLWQSSILLAAVGILSLALRRRKAAVRRALWVLAVAAVPLLPLIGWGLANTGTPSAEIAVMPAYVSPEQSVAWVETAAPLPLAPEPLSDPVAPAAPQMSVSQPPKLSGETVRAPREETSKVYPWALGFLGYAAGGLFFLMLVALGRLRLARWARRGRVLTDARVLNAFREAARELKLRRHYTLLESDAIHAPVAIRVFDPLVLLPTGFSSEGTTDEELLAVAIHELAHIKRHDPLILTLVSLARALLFFHPLVWLAARRVSALSEQCADDAVLEATHAPVPYAQMLARLAEELPRRALGAELAAGLLFSKSAFLHRIEAILSDNRERIRKLSRLALLATIAALLLSIGIAVALPLGERNAATPTDADAAPETFVLAWSALLDAEGGKMIMALNQENVAGDLKFRPMRFDGDALWAELREVKAQDHLLNLSSGIEWIEPRKHRRADTFSDAAILDGSGGKTIYHASFPGFSSIKLKKGQAQLSLEYHPLVTLKSTSLRGACTFDGALEPGDAVAFVTAIGEGDTAEALHLFVWQAQEYTKKQAAYLKRIESSRWWLERGASQVAQLAEEGIAWDAQAASLTGSVGGNWTRELPNGVTVRLLAVGCPAEHPFRWWDAEGRPVAVSKRELYSVPDQESVALFDVIDPYRMLENKEEPCIFSVRLPVSERGEHTDIGVSLGDGVWEQVGAFTKAGEDIVNGDTTYALEKVEVTWRKDERTRRPGILRPFMRFTQKDAMDVSLVVVEKNGTEHPLFAFPMIQGEQPAAGQAHILYSAAHADIGDVEEYRLRTRPRRRVTFEHVRLKPRNATPSADNDQPLAQPQQRLPAEFPDLDFVLTKSPEPAARMEVKEIAEPPTDANLFRPLDSAQTKEETPGADEAPPIASEPVPPTSAVPADSSSGSASSEEARRSVPILSHIPIVKRLVNKSSKGMRPSVPLVFEPPPVSASESMSGEGDSEPFGVRIRDQVEIEARWFVIKKAAAEALGIGHPDDILVLSTEEVKTLLGRGGALDVGRKDVTLLSSPHVLVCSGRRQDLNLTTNASYVSGYRKALARPGERSKHNYFWVPEVGRYEPSNSSLSVLPETDDADVMFAHLATQCVQSSLVSCKGKVPIPEEGTTFPVYVGEIVKNTLAVELDETMAANLRLRPGEFLLIPAEFSRTRYGSNVRKMNPKEFDPGKDPAPMIADDETACVLLNATALMVREFPAKETALPSETVTARPVARRESDADGGFRVGNHIFHQNDVADILAIWAMPARSRRSETPVVGWGGAESRAIHEAFLRTLAQLAGTQNWSYAAAQPSETSVPVLPIAGSDFATSGVMLLRGGYLMVQQTQPIHDRIADILAELRKPVSSGLQWPGNRCGIFGKVMSEKTGAPVAQAFVFVFYPKTYEGYFLRTAADGSFAFDRIPAGDYLLAVVATDFAVFPKFEAGKGGDALVPVKIAVDAPRKEVIFKLSPLPPGTAGAMALAE